MLFGLPPISGNVFWYLLFGFVITTAIIWGRLYCGWVCPFGAVQEFLGGAIQSKMKLSFILDKRLANLKYVILPTILVAMYVTHNFTIAEYVEPFATFFLGKGEALMWAVLAVVLVASMIFHRFYCKHLCAIGALIGLLSRFRIFEIRRWRECDKCGICENFCKIGAINKGKISVKECISCDVCERNYQSDFCPHWKVRER
jgi:polyferredoxin